MLEGILNTAQDQIAKMEAQKVTLTKEIDDFYSEFKNHPYHLHSIFIHEGTDNSGHYYTYIRDPNTNQYIKYSDIHVNDATNEDVWADSFGESKTPRAAYCLYYVNKKQWESMKSDNLRSF